MKIVATSGTWDLFHIAHMKFLEKSRALGDKLVVGIKTDEKVIEQKKYYPIMSLEERVKALELCPSVDEVYIHTESVEEGVPGLIRYCKADIFTGGLDRAADPFILPFIETGYPVEYVVIDSEIHLHTTDIKDRIFRFYEDFEYPEIFAICRQGLVQIRYNQETLKRRISDCESSSRYKSDPEYTKRVELLQDRLLDLIEYEKGCLRLLERVDHY